jgi:hypothetical protein
MDDKQVGPVYRPVPLWNVLVFGSSDGAAHRSVSFLRARGVGEPRRGDVAQSMAHGDGGMSCGGFRSLGGRRGVRRLLEKCGCHAGIRKAEEDSRCGRLVALRGTVYDPGVRILLFADSDERRASGVHLFEFDRAGSRCDLLAACGYRPTGGATEGTNDRTVGESTDAVVASSFGENQDTAVDAVRRAANSDARSATGSDRLGTDRCSRSVGV